MAWATSFLLPSSSTSQFSSFSSSFLFQPLPVSADGISISSSYKFGDISYKKSHFKNSTIKNPSLINYRTPRRLCCRAAEYKFPDPIPEFAEAETEKFKNHLLNKLSKKKDYFGDSIEEVVGICTEIFNNFLHTEYGGPGTLLVIPFIDMADTLNERGLPGGPQAARAAVKWAQNHVDKDWKAWLSNGSS
ncbi:hypothetical protein M9H77_10106 [Catharanthus roseus]|uniref:Uncharacterized protein n=1 Tax=Catharanthus roseus TaxID=4058 RepID=A0ACC0C2I6_CATRO|nr:hypothetical protein M9H77_10106 [Catharanthus roseus]